VKIENKFIPQSPRFACLSYTPKKFYLDNDKYIETNTQAMEALKQTLGKEYLFIVSHCDFTFTV